LNLFLYCVLRLMLGTGCGYGMITVYDLCIELSLVAISSMGQWRTYMPLNGTCLHTSHCQSVPRSVLRDTPPSSNHTIVTTTVKSIHRQAFTFAIRNYVKLASLYHTQQELNIHPMAYLMYVLPLHCVRDTTNLQDSPVRAS
jgi:hypothetical protein